MKVAIMQPYFFPYIGYFQLINAVDQFVLYDNIQFTKKGWIQRNRILLNGKDTYISLPLKKDSSTLNVNQRYISEDFFNNGNKKLLRQINAAYQKAPYFNQVFPVLENILQYNDNNLFNYIYHSLIKILNFLNISTPLIKSSELNFDIEQYKGQEKVIEICKSLNATDYINPIGGIELYDKNEFGKHNISLSFLKSNPIIYKQFNNDFIPWLSIIDILMFNDKKTITEFLTNFELI